MDPPLSRSVCSVAMYWRGAKERSSKERERFNLVRQGIVNVFVRHFCLCVSTVVVYHTVLLVFISRNQPSRQVDICSSYGPIHTCPVFLVSTSGLVIKLAHGGLQVMTIRFISIIEYDRNFFSRSRSNFILLLIKLPHTNFETLVISHWYTVHCIDVLVLGYGNTAQG